MRRITLRCNRSCTPALPGESDGGPEPAGELPVIIRPGIVPPEEAPGSRVFVGTRSKND